MSPPVKNEVKILRECKVTSKKSVRRVHLKVEQNIGEYQNNIKSEMCMNPA